MALNVAMLATYVTQAGGLLASLKEAGKALERETGFVHRAWPARINGKTGFLIWDFVIYNEITFFPEDGSEITRFFHSFSDADTEVEFEKLVKKFGSA